MDYVIEMVDITKKFPGVIANDKVNFKLKKGEIHALLGENGAGKSTLMSVLFGLYQPDGGKIKVYGEEVKINNPNDANELNIGMVHQHFKLVHNFTVAENIVLGMEDTKNGFISMKDSIKKINDLSKKYGLKVEANSIIEDISVGMQQRVEILKMLYRDADILIFDEPTAVLTPQEIEELMDIMRQFAKEGKSIVLITHKLREIKAVAERCTVLRKGKCIDTVEVKDTSMEEMAEMMVGRKVLFDIEKQENEVNDTILTVEKLNVRDLINNKLLVKDVSFEVKEGEILAVAGIEGNGQTQLVEAITGLRKIDSGKVWFKDKDITYAPVREKTLQGIAHIPEDRHKYGLVLDFTLEENLILQDYFKPQFQNYGFLNFPEIHKHAEELIENYDIRSGKGRLTLTRSISGGNQQKAIIARELSRDNSLVIAVQPTRGLDVGAIEYIRKSLLQKRKENKAVLLLSLELDDVMNLADRIVVMYEGEIVANVMAEDTNENKLGLYMAGSKRGDGYEKN
ncbi:MAG: ABC transporter ATP-binding protein [Candidatus Izemoplasmatales bacterium]